MGMEEQDYPYIDEYGTTWLDRSTMKAEYTGPCFYCGALTDRVDINFAAFFCNSPADRAGIESDLRHDYGGEYDDDDLARWNGEGGRV